VDAIKWRILQSPTAQDNIYFCFPILGFITETAREENVTVINRKELLSYGL
jgi:hypothetical protein